MYSQLYHPSLEVDPLMQEEEEEEEGGGSDGGGPLGECLKTLDYLKGRMQFGPADVKEIVKKSMCFCV